MSELTLKERFALIGLNAQDSLHMTTAKKAALRCISAAAVLENHMESIWPSADKLESELKDSANLSTHELKKIETGIKECLSEKQLIREIPNLLACDLDYVTASVNIFEYYSDKEEYTRQTEGIRAELMEEGNVTDEVICLLWLLRESGAFYDLFSQEEQKYLSPRISELYIQSPLAKMLLPIETHKGFEAFSQKFLKKKHELFSTQLGTGFLYTFPFIERSQSIFIDVEAWFSGDDKRLESVLKRLESKGHEVHILRAGKVPLLKIDNFYYECVPTQKVIKAPIQGMRLRRYIM